jgi:hypothetical protein
MQGTVVLMFRYVDGYLAVAACARSGRMMRARAVRGMVARRTSSSRSFILCCQLLTNLMPSCVLALAKVLNFDEAADSCGLYSEIHRIGRAMRKRKVKHGHADCSLSYLISGARLLLDSCKRLYRYHRTWVAEWGTPSGVVKAETHTRCAVIGSQSVGCASRQKVSRRNRFARE